MVVEIVTVTDQLPVLLLKEPWTCAYKDCLQRAFILIYVEGELEILRAMGFPIVSTETIVRIALCSRHYREYENFKKLQGKQTVR